MDGDRPMVAVAAAMAGVVVYLLVAMAGGDGTPAPAPGGEAAAVGGSGGGRTPWSDPPALEPKKGSGQETIAGSVTDAGGQPVAGVWVTAEVETGEEDDAGPGLGGAVSYSW